MERKLFHRVPEGKMIAGVCTGLAEYFDIDPVLVRALFLVLCFAGGFGFLFYAILWIIAPAKSR